MICGWYYYKKPEWIRDSIDYLKIRILNEALSYYHFISLNNFVNSTKALNNFKLSKSLTNSLLLKNEFDTRFVNEKQYTTS